MSIREIDRQMEQLQSKKLALVEKQFNDLKKQGWFAMLQAHYESSSSKTPEYKSFHRIFKSQFSQLLKDNFQIKEIRISKANHFDVSGFFQLENGNIYYFSIGDLRWDKTFMIRTAKSFEDFTGDSNQYLDTEDFDIFMDGLRRIVK